MTVVEQKFQISYRKYLQPRYARELSLILNDIHSSIGSQNCTALETRPASRFSWSEIHNFTKSHLGGSQMSSNSLLGQLLLLYINNDQAKNSHESKGLHAKEPKHDPKEDHNHWLHNSFSKIHPGEAHVEEVFVQFTKESSHLLVVVSNRLASLVL